MRIHCLLSFGNEKSNLKNVSDLPVNRKQILNSKAMPNINNWYFRFFLVQYLRQTFKYSSIILCIIADLFFALTMNR